MISFDLISWRGQGPRMFDTLLRQSPGHCGKPRACWRAPSQSSMSPLSLLKFTSTSHVCSFGSSKAVVCRQEESHREEKKQILAWCQDPGFESLPCHLQTREPAFSFPEPQFTHWRRRENFFMKILLSGFWLQCHNIYKRDLFITQWRCYFKGHVSPWHVDGMPRCSPGLPASNHPTRTHQGLTRPNCFRGDIIVPRSFHLSVCLPFIMSFDVPLTKAERIPLLQF